MTNWLLPKVVGIVIPACLVMLVGLEHDANYDYSGKLPATGDYFITVARPTQSKGRSRYKLTVTVR